MKFVFAHKLSTYIMVLCAYFAVTLGGFLNDAWVLGVLLGIIGSWFWEPPRINFERWTWRWTALALLAFAYSALTVLGGRDILLVGAEFLMFLLVVKLFNRKQCKDYKQAYVLSFLMLVSGTVLNYEFTYGFFFVGFVISSTWALILLHLRTEMEDNFLLKHKDDRPSERVEVNRILNSRRIVGGRFFAGTAAVSIIIFAFSTIFFFLIPRIGFGFFFQKNRNAMHMAGFSDGVRLGGHGLIKDNRTIVMRVKVDKPYQGFHAPAIHWRGVAFDRYENGIWRRTPQAPVSKQRMTYFENRPLHHMLYGAVSEDVEAPALAARIRAATRQQIYLEPLGNDVLFGASMPEAFEFGRVSGGKSPRPGRNDELRMPHSQGIKYTVFSDLTPDPADELRDAPDNFLPPGFKVYTEWPRDQITERTRAKAREITAGATNNYDKARAIETWLSSQLGYTLRMKSPGDQEPIDFFLFDRQKGHCEYFSSAMTIMLRTLGIPARNVNGFLGGEWNEYDDYIAVRAGDAHSWVEVYFAGHGWVTFDPTPAGSGDQLGRGDDGMLDRARRFFDNLRFKWFKWVIEYDIYQQLSIFKSIGKKLKGGTSGARSLIASIKRWATNHAWTTGIGLGALVGLSIFVGWWRRRRDVGLGISVGGARRRHRRPVATLYNGALDLLRKRGFPRPPARTPREHALDLEAAGAPGASSFRELTELYYRAEYGRGDPPAARADDTDDLARAEQLLAAVRAAFHQAKRSKSK